MFAPGAGPDFVTNPLYLVPFAFEGLLRTVFYFRAVLCLNLIWGSMKFLYEYPTMASLALSLCISLIKHYDYLTSFLIVDQSLSRELESWSLPRSLLMKLHLSLF